MTKNSKSTSAIDQLIRLQRRFQIKVEPLEANDGTSKLLKARLHLNDQHWDLYVDDEYGEFEVNQLIAIYLVLGSLEDFEEARDYGHWCQINLVQPNVQWQHYYHYLATAYQEISQLIGVIDSYINPLDYQLKSGDYQQLLKHDL